MHLPQDPSERILPEPLGGAAPLSENDIPGVRDLNLSRELNSPLKLKCIVQPYAWGKVGQDSLIARITGDRRNIPMAELWMGSHPKASSSLTINGHEISLRDLIKQYPIEILGKDTVARFGAELPFLFKVLSVGAPLSIQAHPDKPLAQILHTKDPKNYPDDNHKPEVAIALTPVEALCGFRTLDEIKAICVKTPELQELFGEDLNKRVNAHDKETDNSLLKALYSKVMNSDEHTIEHLCGKLFERLSSSVERTAEDNWVLSLRANYPTGDVGLFSFYMLNRLELTPGEGIFLEANTPHAYLSGDMVECMANSDNVVRAGLTPKFKDIPTLLEMLEYKSSSDLIRKVERKAEEPCPGFNLPVAEFRIHLLSSDSTGTKCITQNSVEMLFMSSGSCVINSGSDLCAMKQGECFLIPGKIDSYTVENIEGTLFRISVPE